MNLLVKDIIDFDLLDGAKIVAGSLGAFNRILWINLMEILDSLDSLQEGELLVTTGYQLDDREQFQNIIFKLKNLGVCGMAIQTGYYINEIPSYIIESANKYDFPILEIPSHLTFSHIMHVLLDNIISHKENGDDRDLINIKSKMNNIMKLPGRNYLLDMLDTAVDYKVYFLYLYIDIVNSKRDKEIVLCIINDIKKYLLTVSKQIEIESVGKKVLFSLSLKENVTFEWIRYNLLKVLNILIKKYKGRLLIGISILNNCDNLNEAIGECIKNEKLLEDNGVIKGICSTNDSNLFKLFDNYNLNYNYSKEFAYNTLKSIIDYDNIHNTNYLETLHLYLINECSITNTANQLYVHRHTLTNRINKVCEICDINFENHYSRMIYSLALFFYSCFVI